MRLVKMLVRQDRARSLGMTRREWVYGQVAGRLIVASGTLAMKRKDVHEVNHCLAALRAGDSEHDECLLPTDSIVRLDDKVVVLSNRDDLAALIYDADLEWLTTVDGTPNSASYEIADRLLSR